jgi:tetratricopeptide (TPR) repeat protein
MMSHQAYFEFLAGSDQHAPAWHPVLGGLAVLRLIDSRLGGEPGGRSDWTSCESAKSAVMALREGDPVRAILLQLIAAVAGDEMKREVIGRGLLAYGRALNFEGRWGLACDVFGTADRITGAPHNVPISIESNVALGAAARRMSDWEKSAHAYSRAYHLAETIADRSSELLVEAGRATNHMMRGNLPTAGYILEGVIDEARSAGLNDVLGPALHARMSLLHLRGEYAEAVRAGHEALALMNDLTARDGVLGDIAAAFGGMGMNESARDGYLIVAATAQSQWVRWQATLNLMELAALDDREADFDACARELANAPLDPRLRAHYYIFLGTGQQQFGKEAEAHASITEGLSVAEKNQLHQIAHEATVALAALRSHAASKRALITPPSEVPLFLQEIASELSDLREAAMSSPF